MCNAVNVSEFKKKSRNFKSESIMTSRSLVWSSVVSEMSSMRYCCEQGAFLELVLIEQLKHFSLAKFSCHFLLHVVNELMPL